MMSATILWVHPTVLPPSLILSSGMGLIDLPLRGSAHEGH